MGRYVFPLAQAGQLPLAKLGGKARNVWRLSQIPGVRLPASAVMVADAFRHFVEANFSPREQAQLAEDYLERNDRRGVLARLAHAPMPPAIRRELLAAVPPRAVVMVRSSGTREDGGQTSLAGHYESIVSRTEVNELMFTVKTCWLVGLRVNLDLLHTDPTLSSVQRFRRALSSLALLVQHVVNARQSGVFFTQSPHHPHRALVAANFGTCHSVVDGKMSTDLFVLDGGRVEEANLKYKFEMTVLTQNPDALWSGQHLATPVGRAVYHLPYHDYIGSARVPEPLSAAPAVTNPQLWALHQVASQVREALGYELDMEWSFAQGKLVVLQARPITTGPGVALTLDPDSTYSVASAGVAEGTVRIVHSAEEIGKVEPGDIMVVSATDPDYMPAFYRAAGVISEDGSPLSHTAIVARELKIPCLTGVENATSGAFRDGERIVLDANRGRITRPGAEAVKGEQARSSGLRSNQVVYRVEHLSFLPRRGPVRIAASALLHHFYSTTGWADATEQALRAHLGALRRGYGVGPFAVHWDLLDRADPAVKALRAAVQGRRTR